MSQNPLHVFKVVKSTAGVGQGTRWVVEGLHQRFQLTVACVSEGGAELATYLNSFPGVRAFPLSMERYGIDPLGDARLALQLAGIMRNERFDVVHAHASKPGILARMAAIGTGLPVIYQPAGFAFHDWTARPKARIIAGVERLAAHYLTSYILCACEEECDLARRWHVGHEEQYVPIYTGIDTKPFDMPVDRHALRDSIGVPHDAVLVGTVGRLNPQKAPKDFVQAAAGVHTRHPQAHFVWIGSGQMEAEVRTLVAAYGLQDVFHFAGERRDVPALLHALDIFVLASRWEGFSFSVLEAMAAHLPVVATRVTGAAEAVAHGENGLLVAIGDIQALIQAIDSLVGDIALAQRYGAHSRQRIEQQFTREQMLNQIAALYERAAAQGRMRYKQISAISTK